MKKVFHLIIILSLFPLYQFSQFQVREKVEVNVSYGDGVPFNVQEIFLTDSENSLFYRGSLDVKTNSCTLYNVEPGEYLFGFDIGEELVLSQHVYTIKSDPDSSSVISELGFENLVEMCENRNLKIHLHVANEDNSGTGIIKIEEYSTNDYDVVQYCYYIPSIAQPRTEDTGTNGLNEQQPPDSRLNRNNRSARSCRSTFLFDSVHKTFYADYSGILGNADCSYCNGTGYGRYTLNLAENDITYNSNCDKLKIKNVKVSFFKLPFKENQNLNPSEFGKHSVTITVVKGGSKIESRDCVKQGDKCTCKFDGEFFINVLHSSYIRDEMSIRDMLCSFFSIPEIKNNVAVGKKGYSNVLHAANFRKAIIDHENLHCAQFRMLIEGFFKGNFGSQNPIPFYYKNDPGDLILWDNKTLADKICEKMKDIPCCDSAGACNKSLCDREKDNVLKSAVNLMDDLIEKRLKKLGKKKWLELPAWHFTFLQFNKYASGGN